VSVPAREGISASSPFIVEALVCRGLFLVLQ